MLIDLDNIPYSSKQMNKLVLNIPVWIKQQTNMNTVPSPVHNPAVIENTNMFDEDTNVDDEVQYIQTIPADVVAQSYSSANPYQVPQSILIQQ